MEVQTFIGFNLSLEEVEFLIYILNFYEQESESSLLDDYDLSRFDFCCSLCNALVSLVVDDEETY